jgi:uncharacterized protein
MSERDGFQPGVPSWVDNLGVDPRRLTDFYGALFGWDFVGPGPMPGDPPGEYFVARLRGRDVAGIASASPEDEVKPGWNTYVEVESADRTAEAVDRAGGTVLVDPFDALPAGRMAVVADRAGARFCVWEPRERKGAQLVNEPGAWSMSTLNAPDPGDAAQFYGEVFGWQPESFELGEVEVTLFRLPGYLGGEPQQPVPRDVVATLFGLEGAEAGAHWSVDFWIDDVDAAAAKVPDLGGAVIAPPYDISMMRQAVLADPNGAAFSATQLMAGP